MTKQKERAVSRAREITGYSVAAAALIVIFVSAVFFYKCIPPSIMIPAAGVVTFFGVLIVSSLLSGDANLQTGEIRKAIAASLVVVYFFVLALLLFADSSPLKDVSKSPISAPAATATENMDSTPSEATATSSQLAPLDEIMKDFLKDFTTLIGVVIGFYFGGRTVQETIAKFKPGDQTTGTVTPTPPTPPQTSTPPANGTPPTEVG